MRRCFDGVPSLAVEELDRRIALHLEPLAERLAPTHPPQHPFRASRRALWASAGPFRRLRTAFSSHFEPFSSISAGSRLTPSHPHPHPALLDPPFERPEKHVDFHWIHTVLAILGLEIHPKRASWPASSSFCMFSFKLLNFGLLAIWSIKLLGPSSFLGALRTKP